MMDFRVPAVVQMPDVALQRRAAAWSYLGRELFRWAQSAVSQQTAEDFLARLHQLESWMPFVDDALRFRPADGAMIRQRYDVASAVLWCAHQASSQHWTLDQPSRTHFASAARDAPPFISCREAWAWHCTHLLANTAVQSRTLSVAVVLSDELLQDRGDVAHLVLEVTTPGEGCIVHHPMQSVLQCHADPEFLQSMEHAWTSACTLAQRGSRGDWLVAGPAVHAIQGQWRTGVHPSVDGRWHLLLNDRPVRQVKGGSTGGAVARGWWYLLTGRVPDDGVFVLAAIDASGRLGGVGGITAKLQAILRDPTADTVARSGSSISVARRLWCSRDAA